MELVLEKETIHGPKKQKEASNLQELTDRYPFPHVCTNWDLLSDVFTTFDSSDLDEKSF